MKKLLTVIFVFASLLEINAQTNVEIFFWDNCKNAIVKSEYEINRLDNHKDDFYVSQKSIVNLPLGFYMITFARTNNDLMGIVYDTLHIRNSRKIRDTLEIPKILVMYQNVLHPEPGFNYYNCERICNGHETETYKNGNIRLDGIFKNGKPIEITKYRENGIKANKYWYEFGTEFYKRVENYDDYGNLKEYEIHKRKKHMFVSKIYDSKGKFLRKESHK